MGHDGGSSLDAICVEGKKKKQQHNINCPPSQAQTLPDTPPPLPPPVHFPSQILCSRWKHGIIFEGGGWKRQRQIRSWTTFILPPSPPLRNFWLQPQHNVFFTWGETRGVWVAGKIHIKSHGYVTSLREEIHWVTTRWILGNIVTCVVTFKIKERLSGEDETR